MARPVTGKVMEDQIWVRQRNGTWYCYARKRVWRDGKTVELERRLLGKADERGGELRPTRPKRRPAAKKDAAVATADGAKTKGGEQVARQASDAARGRTDEGAAVLQNLAQTLGLESDEGTGWAGLCQTMEEHNKKMQVIGAIVVMRRRGAPNGEIVAAVTEAFDVTEAYVLAIMEAQVA